MRDQVDRSVGREKIQLGVDSQRFFAEVVPGLCTTTGECPIVFPAVLECRNLQIRTPVGSHYDLAILVLQRDLAVRLPFLLADKGMEPALTASAFAAIALLGCIVFAELA